VSIRHTAALVVLGLAAGLAHAQTPGFYAVGRYMDVGNSLVNTVSANGLVAGGRTRIPGDNSVGFTWTQTGGRQDVVGPGFPPTTEVLGLSANGSVSVGFTDLPTTDLMAYRRAGTGPLQSLGTLAPYTGSIAYGVSGDGEVVAGDLLPSQAFANRAFRWTPTSGLQPLPLAPGDANSSARDISRDGSVIVGRSGTASQSDFDAVYWDSSGVHVLPRPDLFSAYALDVNYNGSVIVGAASQQLRATVWRQGNRTELPMLGTGSSVANGVNDEGAVVGVNFVNGDQPEPAGVWTLGRGTELLRDYLASQGVAVPASVRLVATADISADGRVFVGRYFDDNGVDTGFVAVIPSPAGVLLVAPVLIWFIRPQRKG